MDPELKRILIALAVGQFAWMAKDIFTANRTQTQSNTKSIGALKERLTRAEKDIGAAHDLIRENKQQGGSS